MRSRQKNSSSKNNRASHQAPPSLWQENSAELAIQLLAALDFEGAQSAFNNWIPQASMDPSIEQKEPAAFAAIRAAKDWGPLLSEWINTGKQLLPMNALQLDNLLIQYQNYDFGKWLKLFSQNLLQLFLRMTQDLIRIHNPSVNEGQKTLTDQPNKEPTPAKTKKSGTQKNNQNNKAFKQAAKEANLLYPVITKITGHLLSKHATTKTLGQANDLLKLAFKAFHMDGRYSYLLAHCYYKNRKKEQANQQFAYSLLYYPELTPSFNEDKALFQFPKEIVALIKKQPQPAKAVTLGVIKGIFKLIELPSDLHFSDQQHQDALQCYLALQQAEAAAYQPRKNLRQLADTRKALMDADQVLGKEYMKMIKVREGR